MGISGSEILRGERKEKGPKKDAFCQQKWASLGVKFQGGKRKEKGPKMYAYCQQKWASLGVKF